MPLTIRATRRRNRRTILAWAIAVACSGGQAASAAAQFKWSAPLPVAVAGGIGTLGALATDSQGNWVAVWRSFDNPAIAGLASAASADGGVNWSVAQVVAGSGLINVAGAFGVPALATDTQGNWVAVWHTADLVGTSTGADIDIWSATSADAAASWNAGPNVNTNATGDSGGDRDAAIAADGLGSWITVWESDENLGGGIGTDTDILYATSSDAGASWSPPLPLNASAATDTGADESAEIATDGSGNWIAVWESRDDQAGSIGSDYDILYATSGDAGATWSAVKPLNSDASSDSDADMDQAPALATDGVGTWIAVWTHTSGGFAFDTEIRSAISLDAGATWSLPQVLHSYMRTVTSLEVLPEIAADGLGNWIVVWHSDETLGGSIGSDTDMFFVFSADAGASWTPTRPLNSNAAGGDANTEPDTFPALAADTAGNWMALWRSGEDDLAVGTPPVMVFATGPEPCGNDVCEPGEDTSSCPVDCGFCDQPLAAVACIEGGRALLQIKDRADDKKDQLKWKLSRGGAFDQAALGEPVLNTSYAVCVYDQTGSIATLAAELALEPNLRWRSNAPKGFKLKDKARAADGIQVVKLKTGEEGKTKAILKAKGVNLPTPVPVSAMETFDQDPSVVVQLVSDAGLCLTSEFLPGDTSNNDGEQFKAKGP